MAKSKPSPKRGARGQGIGRGPITVVTAQSGPALSGPGKVVGTDRWSGMTNTRSTKVAGPSRWP